MVLAIARRRRVPDVLEKPARARAVDRFLCVGYDADRGEHDAGRLERSRASCRCRRRSCGWQALRHWSQRGGGSATLRRRFSNVRRKPVSQSRPSTSSRCWLSSAAARNEVRASAAAQGIDAEDVMVAPPPANPFSGDVVVMTRDEYYVGRFDWLETPRVSLETSAFRGRAGQCSKRRRKTPAARRFLVWSRYPAIDVEAAADGGTLVQFLRRPLSRVDRLSGPTVRALRRRADDATATDATRPRACAAACPRRGPSTGSRARRARAI